MASMDVHCDQLVEVLSKRGVLTSSWQPNLQKVKNAFPEALALIPSEWTEAVESSADIPTMGYWRCQQMFDELLRKKQEAGEAGKTWLGSYKDPLLHKWDVILRAYRKGNIYLAETATLLDVNSTYEIPALKKEVGLCESRIGQLHKRIRDTAAQISRQREDLEGFCQERGITTNNKGSALTTAASILDDTNRAVRKELPTLLAQLHAKIRDPEVRRAVEFYRVFCEFMGFDLSVAATVGDDAAAAAAAAAAATATATETPTRDEARKPLETLALFAEYEGAVASVAELPDLPMSLLGDAAVHAGADDVSPGEIDWGDLGGGGGGGDVVEGTDGASSGADEIDWDIGAEVAAAAAEGETESADTTAGDAQESSPMLDISAMASAEGPESENDGDMIDLGIEMEMDFEDFGIELGDGSGEAAESNDVEHSLVELSAREGLTNDLLELQCFLQQRVHEMAADTGNAYFSLTRDASEVIQKQTEASVSQMLSACNECIAELNGSQLQRFLLLRDSKSALRRLVESVHVKQKRLEQLEEKVFGLKANVRDMEADLGKHQLQLEESVRATKSIQAKCEEALAVVLRQPGGVRIVGSLNSI